MNNIFKILFGFVFCVTLASCHKDNADPDYAIRDEKEQRNSDMDSINKFIDTYSMNVTPDFDVTYTKITNSTQQSIREQTQFPLKDTTVTQILKNGTNDTINYKIYFIKFREGIDKRPTQVDSIHVAYRGVQLTNDQFDAAQTPVWFQIQDLITGWAHIIPNFHTGTYKAGTGGNPSTYNDYGAGVMFLPSGLAYFSSAAGTVPYYSPIIFNFKLYDLQYKDHDGDGIKSKDERRLDPSVPANLRWREDPNLGYDYDGDGHKDINDTDGDGVQNMSDIDDDGDNFTTRSETQKRPEDITTSAPLGHYPYDPIGNEQKGVPNCGNTDFTSSTRIRKYLDSGCHYEP